MKNLLKVSILLSIIAVTISPTLASKTEKRDRVSVRWTDSGALTCDKACDIYFTKIYTFPGKASKVEFVACKASRKATKCMNNKGKKSTRFKGKIKHDTDDLQVNWGKNVKEVDMHTYVVQREVHQQ